MPFATDRARGASSARPACAPCPGPPPPSRLRGPRDARAAAAVPPVPPTGRRTARAAARRVARAGRRLAGERSDPRARRRSGCRHGGCDDPETTTGVPPTVSPATARAAPVAPPSDSDPRRRGTAARHGAASLRAKPRPHRTRRLRLRSPSRARRRRRGSDTRQRGRRRCPSRDRAREGSGSLQTIDPRPVAPASRAPGSR